MNTKNFILVTFFYCNFLITYAVEEELVQEISAAQQKTAADKDAYQAQVKVEHDRMLQEQKDQEDQINKERSEGKISLSEAQSAVNSIEQQTTQNLQKQQEKSQEQLNAFDNDMVELKNQQSVIGQATVQDQVTLNELVQKAQQQQSIKQQTMVLRAKSKVTALQRGVYADDTCYGLVKTYAEQVRLLDNFAKATDQLLATQPLEIDRLKLQSQALIASVHAKIVDASLEALQKAVQKNADPASLTLLKQTIGTLYGCGTLENPIALASDATSQESDIYNDGVELLKLFSSSSLSKSQINDAVRTMKDRLRKSSYTLLDDTATLLNNLSDQILTPLPEEIYEDTQGDSLPNALQDALKVANESLKNLIAQVDVDLNSVVAMTTKTVNSIMTSVTNSLNNKEYDVAQVGAQKAQENLVVSLTYLNSVANSLEARISFITKIVQGRALKPNEQTMLDSCKKLLVDVQQKTKDLLLIKVKVDGSLLALQSGVMQKITDYTKNNDAARTVITSTIGTIFSKLGDVFTNLYTKVSGFFFDRAVTDLGQQVIQIQKGVTQMVADHQTYQKNIQSLCSQADVYAGLSLPDLSADITPMNRKSDSRYTTLVSQVNEAQQLLEMLTIEQQNATERYKTTQLVIAQGRVLQGITSVSSALMKIPDFVKADKTLDTQKIITYYKVPENPTAQDLLWLGGHTFSKRTSLMSVAVDPTNDELTQAGTELYNQIKGKMIFELSADQMGDLIEYYRLKYIASKGQSKTDELDSIRDFSTILNEGGEFSWQQVKSLLKGQPDYEKQASALDPLYGQNSQNLVTALLPLGSIFMGGENTLGLASIYSLTIPSAIEELKNWINSAQSTLGQSSLSDDVANASIAVPDEPTIVENANYLQSIGTDPLQLS